mmetsp:Transcript_25559/g.66861  ORF Transcript_25559/g.66861 Transcript_25559/m.66861 type:complete len:217 (-) Transcript_25559:1125-1775(-)
MSQAHCVHETFPEKKQPLRQVTVLQMMDIRRLPCQALRWIRRTTQRKMSHQISKILFRKRHNVEPRPRILLMAMRTRRHAQRLTKFCGCIRGSSRQSRINRSRGKVSIDPKTLWEHGRFGQIPLSTCRSRKMCFRQKHVKNHFINPALSKILAKIAKGTLPIKAQHSNILRKAQQTCRGLQRITVCMPTCMESVQRPSHTCRTRCSRRGQGTRRPT